MAPIDNSTTQPGPIAATRCGGTGPALPLVAAALAAAAFVGMDTVIKVLSARYDTLQLSFFRFAGGSIFALPLWLWRGAVLPARRDWRLHLLRSVLLLCSLLGYFHALTLLPLALTVTVSYLSPIVVAVLAGPVLGERPGRAVWVALAAGLVGVSVSVWPEVAAGIGPASGSRVVGIASAALAAVSFAFVLLLARKQANRDSIWTILAVQSVLPMLLLAGPATLRWQPVPASDTGSVLLAGGLGTLGLLGMTFAFTRLEASRVAPLDYTGVVWAALLGYFLFAEVPTATTAASACLIIGGCLLLLRR
jgi:drug/metabolite transporter (DMT)-like permease